MIIQPDGPGGYTVFSDDVRYEIGNKVTYVGVYSGEMILESGPPAILPQLCATILYRDSPEGAASGAPYFRVVRVDDEGSVELARIDLNDEVAALPPPEAEHTTGTEADYKIFSELRMHTRLQLVLEKPCRIAVRAYKGDDEIRLGSLQVRFRPPDGLISAQAERAE